VENKNLNPPEPAPETSNNLFGGFGEMDEDTRLALLLALAEGTLNLRDLNSENGTF